MRIDGAFAAGPVLLPTRTVRSGGPALAAEAATGTQSGVRAELPSPVADRLGWLMESDPALAQAINAQLPAARQTSARDLAAYVATARPPQVDVSG